MNTILTRFIAEHAASVEPTAYVLEGRYAQRPRGIFPAAFKRFGGSIAAVSGKQRVVIQNQQSVGGFQVNLTSLASVDGYEASRSATLAYEYFRAAQLPVPLGRAFSSRQYEAALEYFEQHNHAPLLVKPTHTTRGRGITPNVRTEQNLRTAWDNARAVYIRGLGSTSQILLEEQLEGISIRAFVAGERVVAATARIPMFIVGDGKKTVEELAVRNVRLRRRNPFLTEYSLDVHQILQDSCVDPSHVPPRGEILVLSERVGMEYGGVTVDITDHLGSDLQKLAVGAAWAVPGIPVTAVDLVAPQLDSAEGAAVLQIDVEANLAVHHFPWIGQPRPVAEYVARAMIRRAHV
ncbi:hypothetical protein M3B43_01885 [Nesterenkonia massiliensis]|uniref:ATP-grasp domain-containing protein n=1 Tax=Nesterenkonia massiliensis TaxID=1232429 RepID=A0ABT2HN27_9MICC|nr:hypothetical protein [Nesterenkonia massiliensis]MCT1606091.1 hypothetical protein [Nesterenkonia massiliensis]